MQKIQPLKLKYRSELIAKLKEEEVKKAEEQLEKYVSIHRYCFFYERLVSFLAARPSSASSATLP